MSVAGAWEAGYHNGRRDTIKQYDASYKNLPILVLEEDGDFHVDWKGKPGEKNILWGEWAETIESGEFYLVPVPETIVSNIDLSTTA